MSRISCTIYRHYWKNKESAYWKLSDNADKIIATWLKTNIKNITRNKNDYHIFDYENKTIFFYYYTTKEKFGRDITELCAIQLDAIFHNPDSIKKIVDKKIFTSMIEEEFSNEKTVSYIKINSRQIKKSEKQRKKEYDEDKEPKTPSFKFSKKILIYLFFTLAVILISNITFIDNGNQSSVTKIENNKSDKKHEICNKMNIDGITNKIKNGNLHCYIHFIKDKCEGMEISYFNWLKEKGGGVNQIQCKNIYKKLGRKTLTLEYIMKNDTNLNNFILENKNKIKIDTTFFMNEK